MTVELWRVVGTFVALGSGAVVVLVFLGALRLVAWFLRVLFAVDRWL